MAADCPVMWAAGDRSSRHVSLLFFVLLLLWTFRIFFFQFFFLRMGDTAFFWYIQMMIASSLFGMVLVVLLGNNILMQLMLRWTGSKQVQLWKTNRTTEWPLTDRWRWNRSSSVAITGPLVMHGHWTRWCCHLVPYQFGWEKRKVGELDLEVEIGSCHLVDPLLFWNGPETGNWWSVWFAWMATPATWKVVLCITMAAHNGCVRMVGLLTPLASTPCSDACICNEKNSLSDGQSAH